MRRRVALLGMTALLSALRVSQAHAGHPATPPPAPRPLPAPPTLPLVRLEVAHDHVLIVEDVLLRRGGWTSGDLDLFVAFGAPGLPRAVDARLYGGANDDDEVPQPESFTAIPVERALRRPLSARQLLGPSAMVGAVLHLRDPWFGRAIAPTGLVRVRIRTLLDVPGEDAETGHEVVVRLGSHLGEPDALGDLEVASADPKLTVTRASARLCGPEADPYPLAIHAGPEHGPTSSPGPTPVAPVLSLRHATDDLCIRYWTAPNP